MKKADLERAFRIRAGIQGALASCLCDWPVNTYPTSTEHLENCPAHHIIESSRRAHGDWRKPNPEQAKRWKDALK